MPGNIEFQDTKYYEKMSVLLDVLIKERKTEVKDYTEYLAKIVELAKKVKNPDTSNIYPKTINSKARRALYDNLDHDESLALAVDKEIINTKKDAWRGNKIKEREVKNAIKKHIQDETLVESIFELAKNQNDY